jgi:hypothetical protein
LAPKVTIRNLFSLSALVRASVTSNPEVTGSATTTYLPVALNGDEADIANQSYSKVMVADKDEIKHYLKAIHKTLKSKA